MLVRPGVLFFVFSSLVPEITCQTEVADPKADGDQQLAEMMGADLP